MPESEKELYSLALDLELNGKLAEALETYEEVLALNPNHLGSINGRNRVYKVLVPSSKIAAPIEPIDGILEIDVEQAKEKLSSYDHPVRDEIIIEQIITISGEKISIEISWYGDISSDFHFPDSWVSSGGELKGKYGILIFKGIRSKGFMPNEPIICDELVQPSIRAPIFEKSINESLIRINGLWPPPICSIARKAKQQEDEDDQFIQNNPFDFILKLDP